MTALSSRPIAIVQARMGSTRLPGKVLRPVLGEPLLWHTVSRIRSASEVAEVVVATSTAPGDDAIRHFCEQRGVQCYSGSEGDVLDRFYKAATHFGADPIIRITGDCPLVDPGLLEELLLRFRQGDVDYVAVAAGASAFGMRGGVYPDGLDAECVSSAALARAWGEAGTPEDREHVTSYIWRNQKVFRCDHLLSERDYSHVRLTVDTEQDLAVVTEIFRALSRPERTFGLGEVLDFLAAHPELQDINASLRGQEGYAALWKLPSRKAP